MYIKRVCDYITCEIVFWYIKYAFVVINVSNLYYDAFSIYIIYGDDDSLDTHITTAYEREQYYMRYLVVRQNVYVYPFIQYYYIRGGLP